MAKPDKKRFLKWTGILLGGLVVLGGVLLWCFFKYEPTEASRVVTKRDLQAFTLLTVGDLEMRGSPEKATTQISDLTDNYLLVALKKGAEINREIVVSRQGKEWLGDAVAIAIPASTTNSFGGHLRIGDTIDLLTVSKTTTQGTASEVTIFDNLLVVTIPPPNKDPNSSAITLAVPRTKRNDLATAVTGATLVVTRNIGASNHQK